MLFFFNKVCWFAFNVITWLPLNINYAWKRELESIKNIKVTPWLHLFLLFCRHLLHRLNVWTLSICEQCLSLLFILACPFPKLSMLTVLDECFNWAAIICVLHIKLPLIYSPFCFIWIGCIIFHSSFNICYMSLSIHQ